MPSSIRTLGINNALLLAWVGIHPVKVPKGSCAIPSFRPKDTKTISGPALYFFNPLTSSPAFYIFWMLATVCLAWIWAKYPCLFSCTAVKNDGHLVSHHKRKRHQKNNTMPRYVTISAASLPKCLPIFWESCLNTWEKNRRNGGEKLKKKNVSERNMFRESPYLDVGNISNAKHIRMTLNSKRVIHHHKFLIVQNRAQTWWGREGMWGFNMSWQTTYDNKNIEFVYLWKFTLF